MKRTWVLVTVVAVLSLAACGPRSKPVTGVSESPVVATQVLEHPVRAGDTLERIADLYYGDPTRAAAIAAENGIDDPGRLAIGSILALRFGAAEFEAARRRQAALQPFNQGVAALDEGDLESAERQFRLALHTVEDLHEARYNLALVLIKRGRTEEAADHLGVLVTQRPDDVDYRFAFGNALFYQTRYIEAADVFGTILETNPNHRRAAFGHARALHEAGVRDGAIAAWSRYLDLDSDSAWAAEARRLRSELRGG